MKIPNRNRTSLATNHKLLICCLVSLAAIGTTYYYMDPRKEPYQVQWIAMSTSWYCVIVICLVKTFCKSRFGYLLSGIISWTTFAFFMLDNWYVVFHYTIIATRPNDIMIARNFIGVGIAVFGILSSHNSFHKSNQTQNRPQQA